MGNQQWVSCLTGGVAASGAGIKNFYLGGNSSSALINTIGGVIQDNTTKNESGSLESGAAQHRSVRGPKL